MSQPTPTFMRRNYLNGLRPFLRAPRAFLSAGAAAARVCPRWYKEHVLVHNMGKVGSKTIVHSLNETVSDVYVQHTHSLSIDSLNTAEKLVDQMPIQVWRHLDTSRAISRLVRHPPFPIQWKVISPVREPIARDVSLFFECIPMLRPDLAENPDCRVEELIEAFVELIDEDSPLRFVPHPMYWFDNEILPLFGVDVYAKSFDFDRGYVMFESSNAKLVVPRLEDFDKCLSVALQELLGVPHVAITNSNQARDKPRPYYKLYDEFRQRLRLPKTFVDKVYSSKFCNHFYRQTEIEQFRSKWQTQ